MSSGLAERWDVAVRADGGGTTGMGHIVRCCSIALALKEAGASVGFMCSDGQALGYLASHGIDAEVVGSRRVPFSDADAECETIRRRGTSLVIVDSLAASVPYLDQLRDVATVCQITPSVETAAHVDAMINYGGYKNADYYAEAGLDGKLCLFGMRYAPLGRDYWDCERREPAERVRRVLVTCGATDPLGAVPAVVDALDRSGAFEGAVKDVVVGKFALYPEETLASWRAREDVAVHEAPESLLALEAACDLAVCAAGTTIYELMAFGAPVVCFAMVGNQLQVGALDGKIAWCGDVRGDEGRLSAAALERIARAAVSFSGADARRRLVAATAGEVDFSGARRVARALMGLVR